MAFETAFEYDCWGRMQNITYPDGEVVHYEYDRGGLLKNMEGNKNGHRYPYINNLAYNKFGQKAKIEYGNGVEKEFWYDGLTQRVTDIYTRKNGFYESLLWYVYDAIGNVEFLYRSDPAMGETVQSFEYDPTNKLVYAKEHNHGYYENFIEYGTLGRIQNYWLGSTDAISGTQYLNQQSYAYSDLGCAPIEQWGPQHSASLNWDRRGSLRKKQNHTTAESEYYLFDNENHLKVYSNNAQTFSYYGYDASGERTMKFAYNTLEVWNNGGLSTQVLELEKMTLYPNGYMVVDQNGDYTKHYYAESERICSKMGAGNSDITDPCTKVWDDGLDWGALYEKSMYQTNYAHEQMAESIENMNGVYTFSPYAPYCYVWEGKPHYQNDVSAYEELQFFYHSDHLGSTGFVTDINGDVSQSVMYAPFGEVISEYKRGYDNDYITDYLFNGKELDEETGMFYYSARYYYPGLGIFISRDPMEEKYPGISPYAYCGNNPMNRVDPTGETWVSRSVDGVTEVYYDRSVKNQADVNKKYGEKSGVSHLPDGTTVGGQYTLYNDAKNNKYGTVKDQKGNTMDNSRIIYGSNYTVFGTSDNSCNAETLHKNLMGTSYTGPDNPKDYRGYDSYQYAPRNLSEYPSILHDKGYDAAKAKGSGDAFLNTSMWKVDAQLAAFNAALLTAPNVPFTEKVRMAGTAVAFGAISGYKAVGQGAKNLYNKVFK